MLKDLLKRIESTLSSTILHKIIAILLIVFLLQLTSQIWSHCFQVLWQIFKPFVWGALIAYICYPLIAYLKQKKVNSSIAIGAIIVGIVGFIVLLVLTVVPMLYSKIADLFVSLASSVEWISDLLKSNAQLQDFSLIDTFSNQLITFFMGYEKWLPQVVSTIPSWMSSILGYFTDVLFTIIIAIYMMSDFERIQNTFTKVACWFFGDIKVYLSEINESIHVYINSMALVLLIRFVEYCLFYYLIGHSDWLVLGVLSALGAIIPYIGGIAANAIGILSGLMLPMERIIFMLIGIVVLSNVDNYVISPIVHQKRSALGPLTTLLAIFAGGMIGNMVGIMLAIPFVLAIKTIIEVYQERHSA